MFKDKTVLELGAGCDTGDGRGVVNVQELDWNDTEELQNVLEEDDMPDFIIGSDLVYDPDLLPALVRVLEGLLLLSHQRALIASTIRNPETFRQFEDLL
ncbi:Protein fam86a, partial [Spiromyces aspiralis]